jgi:predicted metal-dependent hydrolase
MTSEHQKKVEPIKVREFSFDFPADLDPNWIPSDIYRAHFFNGVSLTMPHLEPYLINTNHQARKAIKDPSPQLLKDMRDFNGQEAHHFECHRRLNDLLTKNGYPEFAKVEVMINKSYRKLSQRSLRTKLAYSAGFETMTQGFTKWMMSYRVELFQFACPYITSFWLMHMVEEAEHKTVAFDVYMAYSGAYLPRMVGLFHGSLHVIGLGFIGLLSALKFDKKLYTLASFLGISRLLGSLIKNVGPSFLRALWPWHHPSNHLDPDWMKDWVQGYSDMPLGQSVPLIDTTNPTMPVPF